MIASSHTVRAAWLATALFALSACGEPYIILEIGADLQIPDEVDSLQVATFDAADLTTPLASQDWPLEAGAQFPLEVLVEPSKSTPTTLRERVTAFKSGDAVAFKEVEHPWKAHRVARATFTLERLP